MQRPWLGGRGVESAHAGAQRRHVHHQRCPGPPKPSAPREHVRLPAHVVVLMTLSVHDFRLCAHYRVCMLGDF
jgi:hypothetical protein